MIIERYIKACLGCMLLTSFYTHTLDLESNNLLISRMTVSDIFGLFSILLFFLNSCLNKRFLTEIPKLYWWALIVCFSFFITIVTSLNVRSTLFEVLILLYLIIISYILYDIFKNDFKTLICLLVLLSCIMSFIGLYDLFAVNNNWITIFKDVSSIHATSGFRYFAQAGNFSFTILTLLIPLSYTKIKNFELSKKFKVLLNITVLITALFMIASGAISIIVSFCLAIVLFVLMNITNKAVRKHFFYLLAVTLIFLVGIYFSASELFDNIVYRIESRITNRKVNTPEASFIIQNFNDSIKAFNDNYVFGTGLGGFVNNYSEFEIHGTYLKVLGETGVIGTIAYFTFLYFFILFIVKSKSKYLILFIPFLVASLISWSYNYHFRKKEFWILFAFIMIVERFSKKEIVNE